MPLKGRPYKSTDIEHFTSAAPIESYFFANFSIICFCVCVGPVFHVTVLFLVRERYREICYLRWRMRQSKGKSAFDTNLIECQRFIILCAVFVCSFSGCWNLWSLFTRWLYTVWFSLLFCSRDIAIAVKFTVSHSAHPWPLDNKNYKQMFLIMLNGNGLNQCFFVFMQ